MAGKPWYNNGEKEILIGINEIIPDGYIRGRLKLSPLLRLHATDMYRLSLSKKSPEELADINTRRGRSVSKTYNTKTLEEKDELVNKRLKTMAAKTDEEKELYSLHLSNSLIGKNAGKKPWNARLTKDSDIRVALSAEKLAKTNKVKYLKLKEENPEYFTNWRNIINDTMRTNGTFNTSLPEDNYYKYLIQIYGEGNVIRGYSDERYPFMCDFYIPSDDLFIELNKSWTHGGHPFNKEDLDDLSKLEEWEDKSKISDYYKNAIYTWTDLDPRKQLIAKANNLNYKAIY